MSKNRDLGNYGSAALFDAHSDVVANTVVQRTADGSINANNVTASTFTGALSGTATSLATARTITLAGDLSGSASFDGSANVTITANVDSKVSRTSSTGSAVIPVGTELQRDASPLAGYFRFNSDTSKFEGYDGVEWGEIAGGGGGASFSSATVIDITTTESGNTFSLGEEVSDALVSLNGAWVSPNDFSLSGNNIVFGFSLEVDDEILVYPIIQNVDDVQLVDNLSSTDATKALSANQGSVIQAALDLKAPLASPALSGVPTAPTANAGTNTTQVATTAFVQTAVSGLVDTAPETLDTLNELAAALGDDPNFATTVSNQIGAKLDSNTWNNSAAANITSTQVTNWDTAYGWGDHGLAGYAPASTTVTTNTTQTISGAKTFSSNTVFNGSVGIGTNTLNFASGSGVVVYGETATRLVLKNAASGTGQFAGFEMSIGDGNAGQIVQWQQQPILFYTNDGVNVSERVRLDTSGNLGIGTSNPTTKLDVNGPIRSVSDESSRAAYFRANANNVGNILQFEESDGTQLWEIVGRGYGADQPFYIYKTSGTGSGFKYIIDSSGNHVFNGNIGIGTSSPSNKLDVIGNVLVQGTQGFNATNETASIYIGDTASEIRAVYDGGLDFYQNSTHRMRIQGGTGNVGIGKTNPSEKLDVAGNISSTGGKIGFNTTDAFSAYGASATHYGITFHNNQAVPVVLSGYYGIGFFEAGAERMRIAGGGNALIGTTTDNGVDKLQVNGSISSNPKVIFSKTFSGTFTADTWYGTDINLSVLGTDILDTFIVTVYQNTYAAGTFHYLTAYKFLIGACPISSNGNARFEIPLLSCVGHAYGSPDIALSWKLEYSGNGPNLEIKSLGGIPTVLDGTDGKNLEIHVTKLN